MSRAPFPLAVGLFAVLTACKLITTVCTLIGCEGVLTVAFSSPPTVPYQVQVLSVELGSRVFNCADPVKCPTAAFDEYTPDKLVVVVTTAAGSTQVALTPRYQNTYENGRQCGVTCRSATVTVGLP